MYPMFDMIMVTCGCCCYLLHIVYPVFDTVMVTLWALLCAGRVCGLHQSEPGSTVHGTGAAGHLQDPHRPPLSLHVSTVEFKLFFKPLYYSHAGSLGCLTWIWLQLLQEERYPFLPEFVVFLCIPVMANLPIFGIFNVRMDADACSCTWGLHEHCYEIPHWKLTGRKITCCIGKLNPCWYCTWLFGLTLYQVRYPPTHQCVCVHNHVMTR